MSIFKGAATALVTPFTDGEVDFVSLASLIDWQISMDIDALVSCGTTGEASTLTDEEHIETVAFTVKTADGRVPVIAGAGSNDTAHAVEMSKQLENEGADALLIVTPYYNKCSQKGLSEHYIKIADSVNIPIIIYSVPGRTGVNITPQTAAALSAHPNIAGIKEASGNISQVVEMARFINDDFALYSGNDDMTVPLLSLGSAGVISTAANVIPADMHKMVMSYLDGDTETALKLQLAAKPLIDALFIDVNPIPVKAALNMMNMIKAEYRLPLCSASHKDMYEIMYQLEKYGVIKAEI